MKTRIWVAIAMTAMVGTTADAACDRPAFQFAFDAIERPGAADVPLTATGVRATARDAVATGQAEMIFDQLPDRVYDDSATMREVVVTRWRCADDLTSHWQNVSTRITPPANDASRLFFVAQYGPAPT